MVDKKKPHTAATGTASKTTFDIRNFTGNDLKADHARPDSYFADISAAAQRARLLDALRCSPVTTIEARRNLDILMPAACVHELKHKHGHNIQTIRIRQQTDSGKLHSVAQYVLMVGA
ncbi:MAG: helix-turn-helix domain-containing protein [Bacteroidota bacterium]